MGTGFDVEAVEDTAGQRATLDLTGLARPQRHRTVIATLEALQPGTRLVIVNDHVPRGLKTQLERRYGDRLGWEDIELGEQRATVAMWLNEGPALRSAADLHAVRVS